MAWCRKVGSCICLWRRASVDEAVDPANDGHDVAVKQEGGVDQKIPAIDTSKNQVGGESSITKDKGKHSAADDSDDITTAAADEPPTSAPIIIRFGAHGTSSKLILPVLVTDPALQQLLATCDSASFGVGGKEVHDETYRKATKLNTTDFCTDFCPYAAGIVNVINQLLVPSTHAARSVKAELCKLNIYSSPSGRFKAHVDTPRSEAQIGSLVVCLPSKFKGEFTTIRHVTPINSPRHLPSQSYLPPRQHLSDIARNFTAAYCCRPRLLDLSRRREPDLRLGRPLR